MRFVVVGVGAGILTEFLVAARVLQDLEKRLISIIARRISTGGDHRGAQADGILHADGDRSAFIDVGFRQVKDVVDLRVFDLLNISRINNNRAEEMLLCIYHLLQPDRRIDEGIYNEEIDQYFSYREWKKKHQPLSGVTVREILATEDLNEGALLRIFDGVTAAFYKSDEYNSREYRYSNLSELRKAMKHKEGGTNGKAQ